jgi:hypothetical protein
MLSTCSQKCSCFALFCFFCFFSPKFCQNLPSLEFVGNASLLHLFGGGLYLDFLLKLDWMLYHWFATCIMRVISCADASMQVKTSQRMMLFSFITSTRLYVRDVVRTPRITPIVSAALFHHPMVSGRRDYGKRWPTLSLSLGLTQARHCGYLKTLRLDLRTLEPHAM